MSEVLPSKGFGGFKNSIVFTLLTLYLSTAMFQEFSDALGWYIGIAPATIVTMIAFLWYADKKHVSDVGSLASYNKSERTALYRDQVGKLREHDYEAEGDKTLSWIVYMLLAIVIFGSEFTWANVLF